LLLGLLPLQPQDPGWRRRKLDVTRAAVNQRLQASVEEQASKKLGYQGIRHNFTSMKMKEDLRLLS
jgi:hypothetical protein